MECQFCKKILKNISSLEFHQKTTKYCIKIQNGDINDNQNIDGKFNCSYCAKKFTTKQHLTIHYTTCKEKYKKDGLSKLESKIKELEDENQNLESELLLVKENLNQKNDEITELKNKISNLEGVLKNYEKDQEFIKSLASKPKVINNNKILNINTLNIDKNKVRNILENKFDRNSILNGQKSLAEFAVNNLLKDDSGNLNYICTDPSRHIYRYKDSLGEIQKDIKAKKLTNLLVEGGLTEINTQKSIDWWTNKDGSQDIEKFLELEQKALEINLIKTDNSIFINELSCRTSI